MPFWSRDEYCRQVQSRGSNKSDRSSDGGRESKGAERARGEGRVVFAGKVWR